MPQSLQGSSQEVIESFNGKKATSFSSGQYGHDGVGNVLVHNPVPGRIQATEKRILIFGMSGSKIDDITWIDKQKQRRRHMELTDTAGRILQRMKLRKLFRSPEVRERILNDFNLSSDLVGPGPGENEDKFLTELNEMQDLEGDQLTGER